MRQLTSTVLPLTLVLSATICADQVVFKNGDRLTGRIESAADGKLVILSVVAGKISVAIADVQTFSTDQPIEIHLADGTVLRRQVDPADPNRFSIGPSQTLQAQVLNIADIATINPPPRPAPRWTGNISAGLTKTTGNTHTETRSVSASTVRRSENDRITLALDYARGRQIDQATGTKRIIEDWWRGQAKYDYFVSRRLYAYGDGRYEKDAVALLERRILVGGGAGYQWIETDLTNVRAEAGVASLYERFENVGTGNSEVSVQLGYHLERKITENLSVLNDLTYYPSLDSFSDYYLTTTGELRANLTPRMFGNAKVIFNYDESPAPGRGKTDVKYILGLGLGF